MRAEKGKHKSLRDIQEFQGKLVSLWASIPRAGGSPWQRVNEAHYFRRGDHRSFRRLRGIRTDFRCLFWNVREIARAVVDAGGKVCILRGPANACFGRTLRRKHS
eukprot:4186255-Pyramimonas_sp.AAC.1